MFAITSNIDLKLKEGETLESSICFKDRVLIESAEHHNPLNKEDSLCFMEKKSPKIIKLQTFDYLANNNELHAAATKLQKAYRSYQTRRNLADCAVVVEELWWKALEFAALCQSSILFFESDRTETPTSRWARTTTRVAKLGKGLSKDEKAQKLASIHWLEAIDRRHRYGHNLHFYYDIWLNSESRQPFFYWLDVGDGKEVTLESCSRTQLQDQCIKYLGPKERESYEVIVERGRLVYRQSGVAVDTKGGTKWIFVLSASRNMYVGQKERGLFQHSSFLAGGAAISAGRLIAHGGVLEAIWSYSGHYRPSKESFREFVSFLKEQNVDLTNVKKCPMDDDIPPSGDTDEKLKLKEINEEMGANVGRYFHCQQYLY